MTLFHAFLLGIVQGLTEFIPVSSTAHLLISQYLFGIPASDAMFSFLVIVQLGTLVSLFIFYWKDLLAIAQATLNIRRSTPERNLGLYIVIAVIPALLAGYLLKDAVESLFRQPILEASIRLFAAAVLLSFAEWFSKKNRSLNSMNWLDGLIIGLMQVIAVFPGLYEMLDVIQMPNLGQFLPLLAVGFITAAIVGWFAIKWLIDYLNKHSLYVFAIYCAIVGFILLIAQTF